MSIEDFVRKLNELFRSQAINIYSNANDTIMISVKDEDFSLAKKSAKFYMDKTKDDTKLTSSQKNLIKRIQTIDDYKAHENELTQLYRRLYKNLNESSLSMISLPADAIKRRW